MTCLEIRLPTWVEQGALGGLGFQTTLNLRYSGHETAFQNWADSRGEWDISYGAHYMQQQVSLQEYLQPVVDMFAEARGMANSFLYKDHTDFKIPAGFTGEDKQVIGLGDGSNVNFRTLRLYDIGGGNPYNRVIEKIEGTTDRLWIEGDEKTRVAGAPGPGQYSIDATTGKIVTGDVPAATGGTGPAGEQVVYLQTEFNCHVRFNIDKLRVSALAAWNEGAVVSIPALPIVEKKPQP